MQGRDISVFLWVPKHTTILPGSCLRCGCPDSGAAGEREHGGACWRSWRHSLASGYDPSPSVFEKIGAKQDKFCNVPEESQFISCIGVCSVCVCVKPCQGCFCHLWAAHSETENGVSQEMLQQVGQGGHLVKTWTHNYTHYRLINYFTCNQLVNIYIYLCEFNWLNLISDRTTLQHCFMFAYHNNAHIITVRDTVDIVGWEVCLYTIYITWNALNKEIATFGFFFFCFHTAHYKTSQKL